MCLLNQSQSIDEVDDMFVWRKSYTVVNVEGMWTATNIVHGLTIKQPYLNDNLSQYLNELYWGIEMFCRKEEGQI